MKHLLLSNVLLLFIGSVFGQTTVRTEISGVILAEGNDVEGVAIFNTSSNKGVITNSNGVFSIEVAINDVLEITALQFKTTTIIITKEVVNTKQLKIYLSEQINQLDAVLLTSGLSGNLNLDIKNTKERTVIAIDLGDINKMEFFDERAFDNKVIEHALNSVMNKGMFYGGVNFIALGKLLFKPSRKKKMNYNDDLQAKSLSLSNVYDNPTISKTFNIPIEQVEAFIVFAEAQGLTNELLKKENELVLIEFLVNQSKLFLSETNTKN